MAGKVDERKEYVHVVDGIEHVILCTEEHAKLYAATLRSDFDKAQSDVESKMRTPKNKAAE